MRNAIQEAAKQYVQKVMNDRRVLIHYLRKKDRTPYGVVVALKKDDGNVVMGHSTPKPGTVYTKHTLLLFAIHKALGNGPAPRHMEAKKLWDRMVERSSKYFKADEILVSPPFYKEGVDWNWGRHWLERHREINSTKVFKDV